MFEFIAKNWQDFALLVIAIGGVVKIAAPKTAPYFAKGVKTIEEVDDLIHAALAVMPNNPALKTVDGIVDFVLTVLKTRGYKVDKVFVEQVKTRAQSLLQQNPNVELKSNSNGLLGIEIKK